MRLYGSLQELTSLIIRLASGKTVKIQATEQTAAGETQITIPDVVDGADELVLKDTAATMTNKTLTAPVMTSAQIDSSSKIVLPATASPAQTAAGSMVWDSDDLLLTIGKGSGVPKVIVDTDSTQTLSGKTISGGTVASASITNPTMSGVTINSANRIALSSLTTGVGNNHVLISDANGDLDSEATLAKSRGGAGGDMTNVVFPATGTLVTEDASQTLSNKTLTTPSIAQINTPAQSLAISGTGALTLPAGNNSAQRPGTPANGMIRYNSTDNTFEGYSNGAWAGIGGGGTTDKVTQASHGFVLGDVLYLNGSTYAKAIASAANTAEVVGVVSRVIDASTFEMTLSGEISGLAGLVAGEVYFLSSSTAGLLTVTEPSVVGQVSIPVGVASSASTLYVAPKRGVVVGAANARTTISIANNTASNVVSVVDYNSLKLEGELNVTRSSGGNQRAYYTVEAAKNGAGVWQVSASYTGDDVLYTTLPSWDVASNNLQVTMPLVTNFSSASLTYALNAPAVGASLPLSIDSSALNIVDSAPLSYRNRVINGDMRIDQRNSGAAVTTEAYCLDRWRTWMSTATVFSAQQNAGSVTPPAGYSNYLGCTVTNAVTPTAGQRWSIQQAIEGFNTADLAWGTANAQSITFSFWVRSSLTGVFGGAIRNSAGNRAYPFTYSISSANTWEQKTVTIAGDTIGTWLTNNGVGLALVFSLGAGSTLSGTAGAWAGSDLWSATGSVNVVGTAGATFYLTGVQLEVGSKASAFERRPYGMELALCQRYFYSVHNSLALIAGTASTTSSFYTRYVLPVSPRVSPTVSFVGVGAGNTFSITDDFSNDFATTAPVVSQPISLATGTTGRMQISGFGGTLVVGRFYSGCENSASTARTWFSMEI